MRKTNIMEEFKAKQNLLKQGLSKTKQIKQSTARGYDNKPSKPNRTTGYDHYSKYQYKLENGLLDKFNNRDIAYFFRDVANENGSRYVIANITKDMRSFKICQEKGYTVEDLLSMIEFLFTSGQPYLDTKSLQPTILMSGWCNTIYNDTQLWLKDEYNPKAPKFNNTRPNPGISREWKEEVPTEDVAEIGNWGI